MVFNKKTQDGGLISDQRGHEGWTLHSAKNPGDDLAQRPEKNASRKNQRNPRENQEKWSWRDTTIQYGDQNKSRLIHKEAYQQNRRLMDGGRGRGSYGCRGRRQTPREPSLAKSRLRGSLVESTKVSPGATEGEPKEPNGKKVEKNDSLG